LKTTILGWIWKWEGMGWPLRLWYLACLCSSML